MENIFAKRRARLLAMKAMRENYVPGEKLVTCPHCGGESQRKDVAAALSVCPLCGYHFPMGAYYRLSSVLDPGSFRELHEKLTANDPLRFPGYGAKLDGARRKTGMNEAVVTATGTVGGSRCVVGVLDSRFLMGSMSAAVGEKLTLAIEYAGKNKLPLILFAASGGARMQEGILSLMQMAKTSAALARFSEKGLLYISVLTDPTTGGVTASFASLGDIILAEPGALIGFAGQRVIRDTIRQELPEGFQTAEFALEHGLIDAIVERQDLRATLAHILAMHLSTACQATGCAHNAGDHDVLVSYRAVCDNLENGTAAYNTVTYSDLRPEPMSVEERAVWEKLREAIPSSLIPESLRAGASRRVERAIAAEDNKGQRLFCVFAELAHNLCAVAAVSG